MISHITPDEERRLRAHFATRHAQEPYRAPLEALYLFWQHANQAYFEGALIEPHLDFDYVPSRCLGCCELTPAMVGRCRSPCMPAW